jgi:NodT family efflux transporter outer membrane factor (OMF) lipoprotein
MRPAFEIMKRKALTLVTAAVFLSMQGCVHRGLPSGPAVELPSHFSTSGLALVPARWWTAFEDPTLNRLMERALRGNFTLQMAWDRLDQAMALVKREGAPLWPQVEARAEASRSVQKTSETRLGTQDRTYFTEFLTALNISYEVDLWGRISSLKEAAQLDMKATLEELQTAAITLSAEVAGAWYRLIEGYAQLRLLDEQLKINEKYLEIIRLKLEMGQVSVTDLLQQRQLVESTRGKRLVAETTVKVLRNKLAVLLGMAPGMLELEVPEEFSALPPPPATGVPAELVRRRPDVRAAELRLKAQDKRLAAAIADLFPRISLSAQGQSSSQAIRDLFDNWLASIAASLLSPVFEGGRRRAEVKRQEAALWERLHFYQETVLNALKEVEDALAKEGQQRQYIQSLKKQLELSRKASELTLESYTKGVGDFTRYLTTLLSHQELQRKYLEALKDLFLFRIELYRALAGGFEMKRPRYQAKPERARS